MDSFDVDQYGITFDNNKYRIGIYFSPAEVLSYNFDKGGYVVDLNSLDYEDGGVRLWVYEKDKNGMTTRREIDNPAEWPVQLTELSFKRIMDRKDTLHYMA